MEIDVRNYLSESRMREIAEEEFRDLVRSKSREDYERVINNGSYSVVKQMVDEAVDEDIDTLVRNKVVEILGGLTTFTVFDSGEIFPKKPSRARQVLEEAVEENRDLVRKRVVEIIESLSDYNVLEVIKERFAKQD